MPAAQQSIQLAGLRGGRAVTLPRNCCGTAGPAAPWRLPELQKHGRVLWLRLWAPPVALKSPITLPAAARRMGGAAGPITCAAGGHGAAGARKGPGLAGHRHLGGHSDGLRAGPGNRPKVFVAARGPRELVQLGCAPLSGSYCIVAARRSGHPLADVWWHLHSDIQEEGARGGASRQGGEGPTGRSLQRPLHHLPRTPGGNARRPTASRQAPPAPSQQATHDARCMHGRMPTQTWQQRQRPGGAARLPGPSRERQPCGPEAQGPPRPAAS
jgi:hypothetical protein